MRHSPKKTCFQFSHFDPLSPFQCCNHVTVSTKRISTLIEMGRGGQLRYRQKKNFLEFTEGRGRKRLFCSNVSTLLSLIVGVWSPLCRLFEPVFWASMQPLFMAAFRELIACATMFRNRLWPGSISSPVLAVGMAGSRRK